MFPHFLYAYGKALGCNEGLSSGGDSRVRASPVAMTEVPRLIMKRGIKPSVSAITPAK